MKALIIASLVFFSLRAMSSEVGEEQKSPCPYAVQTNKREAKIVEKPAEEIKADVSATIAK
jgi:hypothetical protein